MTAPTRQAGRTGRLPNSGKPRVTLHSGHVPPAYTPPATLDRYSAIPAASLGMDGNDNVGDCTCADVDHEVKSVEVAAGNPEVASTAAEVLAAYSAITGYSPDDPNSDQGAEIQTVREYWQKNGFRLGGQVHKILLFAELDVRDGDLVEWALDQFGALGIGVNLSNSAMGQFNSGEPWDVVANDGGIDGGHAVALVGYDESYWYVITWGAVQKVTPAWFAKYVEEAWASLTADFVNAHSGDDPLGGTLYDLGQQFAAVTGKPNPVPPPSPAPAPSPVPSPTPSPVDPADVAFAAVLHPWVGAHHVGANHTVQVAAENWLQEKGLVS